MQMNILHSFTKHFTIHNNDYDKQLFDSLVQQMYDDLKNDSDRKYFRARVYDKILNSAKSSLTSEIEYMDLHFSFQSKQIISNVCNVILMKEAKQLHQLFASVSIFDNYVKVCGKKQIEHPYISQFNKLLQKYNAHYDMNSYFYDIQHIQKNPEAVSEVIQFVESLRIH